MLRSTYAGRGAIIARMEQTEEVTGDCVALGPSREFAMTSPTAGRTKAIGYRLGRLLGAGDVVCVSGDLGAGKTAFCRGLGAGWGAAESLTSPTYNLVHVHKRVGGKARLNHLDLYRVSGMRDAASLGFDEILESGDLVVIEWPERVVDRLPKERLWIEISLREDEGRDLRFEACGARYRSLLDALRSALGTLG